MSSNAFAFRRSTDPLLVPIDISATQFVVPTNFFISGPGKGATSFWVCNANNFWVRLRGSGDGITGVGSFVPVTETTGWLFPPGFTGPLSTQYPLFMSALAVVRQGIPAGSGVLEVSYGGGS